jgi:hypothetical protein
MYDTLSKKLLAISRESSFKVFLEQTITNFHGGFFSWKQKLVLLFNLYLTLKIKNWTLGIQDLFIIQNVQHLVKKLLTISRKSSFKIFVEQTITYFHGGFFSWIQKLVLLYYLYLTLKIKNWTLGIQDLFIIQNLRHLVKKLMTISRKSSYKISLEQTQTHFHVGFFSWIQTIVLMYILLDNLIKNWKVGIQNLFIIQNVQHLVKKVIDNFQEKQL